VPEIFLFATASRPAPGAHPTSYPISTRGSFPGVKRPGRETKHLPPSSSEAMNAWYYTRVYPKVSGMAAWSEESKW
jgi:hypothetical protein